MKTILDFSRAKREQHPLVMIAAYDALMARIVAASEADAILVGDSAAMVVHGFPSTVHATIEMMCTHVAAVRRGAPEMLVVGDMPFLTARRGRHAAADAAGALMQAGATAVKIEGVSGHDDVIAHLVGSGIPVMGHLGLTPQSVNQFGGHKVQGKTPAAAAKLINDARALEEAGAFAVVLETIPAPLASMVTERISIPTIGIGAGPNCDGQVQVFHDLLGIYDDQRKMKHAKRYAVLGEVIRNAVRDYISEVQSEAFPTAEHSFEMEESTRTELAHAR